MRVISGTARGTILQSIDEISTRPTLDRVKESLFNIIQDYTEDAVVLDLFAGSGAIGIEFLSRRANKVYFVEKSNKAINVIKNNLNKTKLSDKTIIYNDDYKIALEKVKQEKFDIIYLDPPFKEKYAIEAIKLINKYDLLSKKGIIIIETDEPERDIKEIKNIDIKYKMYDIRKYGRVSLIFLK